MILFVNVIRLFLDSILRSLAQQINFFSCKKNCDEGRLEAKNPLPPLTQVGASTRFVRRSVAQHQILLKRGRMREKRTGVYFSVAWH